LPVTMQRKNVIAVPRRISIPRPLIEKKIVRKMVPKVIQVEEEYEFQSAVTEMKTFFTGADTSGDGMLSYDEWKSANAARGYDAATMQQMFVSVSADFPPCHAMPQGWRAAVCTLFFECGVPFLRADAGCLSLASHQPLLCNIAPR
jgi:hypothetical protein